MSSFGIHAVARSFYSLSLSLLTSPYADSSDNGFVSCVLGFFSFGCCSSSSSLAWRFFLINNAPFSESFFVWVGAAAALGLLAASRMGIWAAGFDLALSTACRYSSNSSVSLTLRWYSSFSFSSESVLKYSASSSSTRLIWLDRRDSSANFSSFSVLCSCRRSYSVRGS